MMNRILLILTAIVFAPSLWAAGDYDLWKEGRGHYYDKDWQKAIDVYQKIIDDFPESRFRCKSGYYIGYCYDKLGEHKKAFDSFSWVIEQKCSKEETVDDAKAKRLQLAYEFAKTDPTYKKVLLDSLDDPNADIRLSAAMWLARLEDNSGMNVFFDIMENDNNQDRRDSATRFIHKIGSAEDKARLDKILAEQRAESKGKATMVRLIIVDLEKDDVTLKLNLPISLFGVVVKSLSEEQLDHIEQSAGVNLRNFNFNLDSLPSGHVLFKVIDADRQEIKLFLE